METITKGVFKYIDENQYNKFQKIYKPEIGDVLFSRIGVIGETKIVDKCGFSIYVSICAIRSLNIDLSNHFLNYLFNSKSFKKDLYKNSLLTASPIKINIIDMYRLKIIYPSSIDEQNKISKFFSLLDKQISLWERKLELSLLFYKYYLDKTIILNNSNEILRFKKFKKIWNEEKIKNILDYEQPTKYIVNSKEYSSDKNLIPVLTAGKTFILGYTNETIGIYEKESIIFDDFTTDCRYIDFKYKVKSSAIKILTSKKGDDLYFVYSSMKKMNMKPETHKRHFISVTSEQSILLPSLEEQQKISSLLKNIEMYISKIKDRIQTLRKFKKYYINRLFI